jgi:uncharacterized protein (TIGR03083 family)
VAAARIALSPGIGQALSVVDIPEPPIDWLGAIERDAEAIDIAARAATGKALVPGCPGWTVTDLLEHVGSVFYRASLIIGQRRERRPHRTETTAPPGDPFGWYEMGRSAILPVLRTADPSTSYWTFRGPNPLRWWLRRLANESAVHRVDAEQAAGLSSSVDAATAADSIDEKLETYLPVLVAQKPLPRPVTVSLRADDLGSAWTITVGAGITVVRHPEQADAVVAADVRDLYLWIWERAPVECVRVIGDAAAADALLLAGRV